MDVISIVVIVLLTALTTAGIVAIVVGRVVKDKSGLTPAEIRQQVADASREQYMAAAQMLETSTEQRLQTTTTSVEAQNRAASASMQEIIKPLSESLKALDAKVGDLETKRADAYARLNEQVTNTSGLLDTLRLETTTLSSALRRSDTRGRWGELALQRIIEMIGMVEHVSFNEQKQQVGEGTGRPDYTIHLPGERVLYVDSKAPMTAYMDAVNETDPERRLAALTAHATALKSHVRALASRKYSDDEAALDYVIMFIPTESSLAAAFEINPSLIEEAAQLGVVLTSPTSFVAVLSNIAMLWQQEAQNKNAQEIVRESRELHSRLGTFIGHFGKIGDSLKKSVENYNSAIGSFDTKVMPKARSIEELGQFSDEIPSIAKLEIEPRVSKYEQAGQLGLVADTDEASA
ncbi:MAG: DNA recombination protein RmuC [Actinomycetes bacterium]